MFQPPQRVSLVSQAASAIREHLASCGPGERLPGERELCRLLGVSRVTVRAALAQLMAQGLVAGRQGQRRVIVGRAGRGRRSGTPHSVVMLSPRLLSALDPRVLLWMNALREALGREGYALEFLHERACYTQRPQRVLEELVGRLRASVWLLYLSTEPMQQWFGARGLPAVIAGSRHAAVPLASVDIDYRAACRHAAGCFLAQGHRSLVLLNPGSVAAGDLESEAGFVQAAAHRPEVAVATAKHDGSVAGVCATLDRLLRRQRPPTAFLVSRPAHALTALGHLVWRGRRFSGETALIARDDDSFLEYAIPSVARYAVDPGVFAQKLARVVLDLALGGVPQPLDLRLLPELIPGQTLG